MTILAITSMYANPLHPGHIECLELSKSETGANELWVIINNDRQAEMKRGTKSFQNEQFRMKIVESLKPVDRVFLSIDEDSSVCASLKHLIHEAKTSGGYEKIIFTKGGDRFATEIPEAILLRSEGVDIVDGLGAKTHSSSDFVTKTKDRADEQELESKLAELPEILTEGRYLEIGNRPWGVYYVMEDSPLYKVKKIIVNPGCRLSLQSHEKRSEHWTVVSGIATVDIRHPEFKSVEQVRILRQNEGCHIPVSYLHRLVNTGTEPLVIVEVQCGEYTGEDDIVRYDDEYGRVK
ncbi:MAG: adenylyltransferase/cytidyltransferase family protein [Candidatus Gracilibacteria bacterium]|nr:adenylyltransferase/cytidyltransferase family protein [Candidatus Gracilibacteria bacterium]